MISAFLSWLFPSPWHPDFDLWCYDIGEGYACD